MQEIKVGTEQSLSAPVGATSVTVTHEWGGRRRPTITGFTPDSIGVHKVFWNTGETEFYDAYVELVTKAEFIADFPAWAAITDAQFASLERVTRRIIQNYTGQKFGPYVAKSQTLQGDGGDSLSLPVRITSLTSVLNNYGDDITDRVEISFSNDKILQRQPAFRGGWYFDPKRDVTENEYELFHQNFNFTVTGNWGWDYVPVEVSEAAKILFNEALDTSGPNALRKQGVFEAELGDFRLRLNADQWGTTGNAQADNLLSAYVDMFMGVA